MRSTALVTCSVSASPQEPFEVDTHMLAGAPAATALDGLAELI